MPLLSIILLSHASTVPYRHFAGVAVKDFKGPDKHNLRSRSTNLANNRNYSIIFTEISLSPETSILLQIIQIIHMTLWIKPEFDREGRTVCQFWLQGGKHNETPTDTS